jgi:broad specificity phosphatase PhoE
MEMHVGDHIGLRWDEIPEDHHLQFRADPWNASRPGGESHADVYARVGRLLGSLRRNSVLVTHGAAALSIRANYLNLKPDDALRYQQPNAGILRLANGSEYFFDADVDHSSLKSK